jgi:hypothetical protein
MVNWRAVAGAAVLAALIWLPAPARGQCIGDCNGDGMVSINELILGVNIALGTASVDDCPAFDPDGNGMVGINELIAAVNNALNGCPATPTATSTTSEEPTGTASTAPTDTATPVATSTATAIPTGTATATITAAPTSTVGEPTATDTPGGATETPTASFTVTAVPTATPTGGGAECGNNILEPGEICDSCEVCTNSCPEDCVVQPCSPTTPTVPFVIDLVPPLGFNPTTVTVLVGYDSSRMSIPGSGTAASVRQRVVAPAPIPLTYAPNDLDYAVRVLVSRNVPVEQIATATFDRCIEQPAPTMDDLACTVETCSQGGSPVPGCTCTVRVP